MDYIKVLDYQLYIVKDNQYQIIDLPFSRYINLLLRPHLVNLKTREIITKRTYKFRNKIPIIINEKMLLLCINSYRLQGAFYINYYEILRYKKQDKGVVIEFRNNHCIHLDSYVCFVNQLAKVRVILENELSNDII